MFALKSYQQGVQRLVAACDADLVGTSHKEGKFHLQVTPQFYDGLRVDADTLGAYLKGCTVANLVGRNTVDVAVQLGLIDPEHVLIIAGIPHAQLLVLGSS
jgi:hypothetical protein